MSDYKAIERLLDKADRFDRLTGPQQAAFRATLTRQLKTVQDPDILTVLQELQNEIGEPDSPTAKKMTADDLVTEYRERYAGLSMRQRGAFKAKVSRLINSATEEGDKETVDKLEALQAEIEETAVRMKKQRILALAKKRRKADK